MSINKEQRLLRYILSEEFNFTFKDKTVVNEVFFYDAVFLIQEKNLKARSIRSGGTVESSFEDENAWNIFYKHATFKEILGSIDSMAWDEIIPNMNRFEDKGFFPPLERAVFSGEIEGKNIDFGTIRRRERRLALEIIREHPLKLLEKEYAYKLIDILEDAWDSKNKKKSNENKNLLLDYMIPRRRGGDKKIKLYNIKAIKFVMERLAKHLSLKCKEYTKRDNYGRTPLDEVNEIDELLYEEIKTFFSKDSEKKDIRISCLSLEELNSLFFKPADYSQTLLKKHHGVKSLRTLFPK